MRSFKLVGKDSRWLTPKEVFQDYPPGTFFLAQYDGEQLDAAFFLAQDSLVVDLRDGERWDEESFKSAGYHLCPIPDGVGLHISN